LEQEECDRHQKEDIIGGVDNLKVKQEVQDVKMKKSGRRIAKKRTKGKAAAITGHGGVHRTGWHRTDPVHQTRAPPYFSRDYANRLKLPREHRTMSTCPVHRTMNIVMASLKI
jgi:hypothetical protein